MDDQTKQPSDNSLPSGQGDLPDPQALVDAALGTGTVPSDASSTQPAEAVNKMEEKVAETIPPELLNTPETTESITKQAPPSAVHEEMPLAFAAAPVTPPTPPVEPESPITPEMPLPVPPVADLPPIVPDQGAPKKKSGASKILLTVLGVFALVGTVLGGYFGYQYLQNSGETPTIAAVSDWTKDECGKCTPDGFQTFWSSKNNVCQKKEIKCGGEDENKTLIEVDCGSSIPKYECDCNGKGFCIATAGNMTCNEAKLIKGCSIVVGASCTQDSSAASAEPNKWVKACDCDGSGGNDHWYDKTGQCHSYGVDGTDVGLCALPCENGGGGDAGPFTWNCTNNGCSTTDERCYVMKYECPGQQGGSCSKGGTGPASSFNFDSKACNETQQIDVGCNDGQTKDFRTKVFGPCATDTPTPTPTPTPTATPTPPPSATPKPILSCVSINKSVSAPKLGDTVTFTCAGSVVPAGTVNLTYRFRYNVSAGAWLTLTPTANKATLKIDEPGDYRVQCRVCGTIDNASVCDPNWGAAQ